jgi:integrase
MSTVRRRISTKGCNRIGDGMSGSIEKYRLKDGSHLWSIRYRIDGEQRRERGFRTQSDAKKALRERLVSIDRSEYVAPTNQTFNAYAEGWLQRAQSRLKPSTFASYSRNLRTHVAPTLGRVPLQRIDSLMLDDLFQKLLIDGRLDDVGGGLSPTTVRYVGTIIGAVLADAAKRGVITRNPMDSATPPRPKQRGDHTVWSQDQVRQFLGSTREDRLYSLWRLLLFTGLRRGEALGLTWDSLDLDAGTLTVSRSLVDVEWSKPIFSTPKTNAGGRTISLDEETLEVLRKHRTAQIQERLHAGAAYSDHGLVFAHEDGTPHHPDRVSKSFRAASKRAGVPNVRLHDLRHCHATLLLLAGVPAHIVQRRLGHSHVSITLSVYAAVMPSQDREAADAFAAVI